MNLRSPRPFRPWSRNAFWRCCLLTLALVCALADLQMSKLRSSPCAQALRTSSTWEERDAPLAQARRVFDATVRLRLALSASELGQRACNAAQQKEKLQGRIERAVLLAANEQLTLPMGSGSLLTVAGRAYLFCLEPHYHPPGGGITPEGWHKGVTVYHAQTPSELRL